MTSRSDKSYSKVQAITLFAMHFLIFAFGLFLARYHAEQEGLDLFILSGMCAVFFVQVWRNILERNGVILLWQTKLTHLSLSAVFLIVGWLAAWLCKSDYFLSSAILLLAQVSLLVHSAWVFYLRQFEK